MWKKILLVQICLCLFLMSGYMAISRCENNFLKEKRADVVAAMSKHYTVADIWYKGKKTAAAIVKAPTVLTSYVISAQETQQYAQPIDPVAEGGITSVYAVSGGQVIETGENNQIGKFIKIKHDTAISVYGKCCRIYVKEGKHVRRGQVIGSFMQEDNNKFYYDLIEE